MLNQDNAVAGELVIFRARVSLFQTCQSDLALSSRALVVLY